MHHIVRHKLMEKAAGRDGDAIVVLDPHADLVEDILEHVPDELTDTVGVHVYVKHFWSPSYCLGIGAP